MKDEKLIETIDRFDAWLAKTVETLAEKGYQHTLESREELETRK